MEQIDFTYNAGETRRFHTVAVLREQTVAAHSWHVAMLLYIIYGQDEPGVRPVLLMAALTHDMAEHKVGDIPSPAKRDMEKRLELKGAQTFRKVWGDMEQEILHNVELDFEGLLTVDELVQLNICDCLDGLAYCVRERTLGNQTITPCYLNYHKYLLETLPPETADDRAWEALHYFESLWELANER